MRDQAYRRDLRRALEQLVKVKSIKADRGHLYITVELPDGSDKQLTSSGSPRDHQHSIDHTIRNLKRYMKGLDK